MTITARAYPHQVVRVDQLYFQAPQLQVRGHQGDLLEELHDNDAVEFARRQYESEHTSPHVAHAKL
jgi:hypothetical protein